MGLKQQDIPSVVSGAVTAGAFAAGMWLGESVGYQFPRSGLFGAAVMLAVSVVWFYWFTRLPSR